MHYLVLVKMEKPGFHEIRKYHASTYLNGNWLVIYARKQSATNAVQNRFS